MNVTIPPSPVRLLPIGTQGPLVVEPVGPQMTKVFFNHSNGQNDVSFSNAVSGLNSGTLADAANYSFRRVHNAEQNGRLYRVDVILVNPAGNCNVENLVLSINAGQPIRGGFYNFVIRSARHEFVSGVNAPTMTAFLGPRIADFLVVNNPNKRAVPAAISVGLARK
jgi:hypothetical protein